MSDRLIERHARTLVGAALCDTRVVFVMGARQVGKSTLVTLVADRDHPAQVLTLDDQATCDAALADPTGLIAAVREPVVIDEVQRAPDLVLAVKETVDRDTRPGRFLLTGSANVLSNRKVEDALTGRMEIVTGRAKSMHRSCTSSTPGYLPTCSPPTPTVSATTTRSPAKLLENFVAMEIVMHAQWAETDVSVHHYRDGSSEIDIVLESRSGDITAIEVKASASLDAASRGAHEEVERSRPKPVALSDRSQPGYQKVLERNPGGGIGWGTGVRSRLRRRP